MLKLFIFLFSTLLFQACQITEEVATSSIASPSYFPGATLRMVLPHNGWKKLGDNLEISLLFPLPINVSGLPNRPYIEASIGSNIRRVYYHSGTGTTALIFRYTIAETDLDTDGVIFGTSVVLNNASMTFSPSTSSVENVPTTLSISDSDIKVDGIIPTLVSISPPVSGTYKTGQDMIYSMSCSEEIYVVGSPYFNIDLLPATVPAVYKSGSGTKVIKFSRLIQAADPKITSIVSGTVLMLNTALGEKIIDQAGNTLSTTIPSTSTTEVIVNPTQPIITSVVATSLNATYTVTQDIDFTVTLDQDVTVTGTPAIPIVLSTGTVLANYLSGSGTSTLLFRYVVQNNHADTDGISLQSPLLLNGATIKATAEGNADAALNYTIPSTSGLIVDAAAGPVVLSTTVSSSSVPVNGFYTEGQNIDFTLNFSSAVNVVSPAPRIPIIVGRTTVYANYLSGTGTSSLIFRYTPTASQEDLDGISLLGPIDLNSGTIKDGSNRPAVLTFAPPSTSSIYVDGTSPTILSVTSSSVGTFTQGTSLSFAVKFSELVSISVSPVLSITVGSTTRHASYISGDGTDTLLFQYIIQAGESDIDGIVVDSFVTGTIKDLRTHTASLAFTPVTFLGATIDAKEAGIASITAPANMTYKIGANLDFIVNWSEATFISGTPKLGLTIGTTSRSATYISSPTSTTSIFRYQIATGDLDTDGIGTTTIQLSGGFIRDSAGNNSGLTFTPPVLTDVKVDGVIPFAEITAPANRYYGAGEHLDFVLTWNEPVTITGSPYLKLTIGTTTVNATVVTTGINSATFRYTVQSNQLDSNGITMLSAIYLNSGITITDAAGNNSYLQIEPPVLTGVKVDAIAPMISAVMSPVNGTYQYLDTIDFTVLWSGPIVITGSPRIGITIGSGQYYATYFGPGTLTNSSIFRYTVGNNKPSHTENESDANGITITSNVLDGSGNIINSYIELNSGTIKDEAQNGADLNFLAPSLTAVLVDGITAILNPTNPISTTMSDGVYCITTGPCDGKKTLAFKLHWSKNIVVNVSSGIPTIQINVGGSNKTASYTSGTGTKDLVFSYNIVSGDFDSDGISVNGQSVALNGALLQYDYSSSLLNSDLDFLTSTAFNTTLNGITVDAAPPTRTSITSNNSIFRPNEIINYTLAFNEAVTVTGTPSIALTVGGSAQTAIYNSGNSTNNLTFSYTVPSSNTHLDLDGINVSPILTLTSASITDAYGNQFANNSLTFPEIDYVFYSNTLARYSASSYTSNTLSTCPNCVTNIIDSSGNANHLTPPVGAFGPQYFASSFGLGNSPYLQFNNSSMLTTTTQMSIKYVIFVMRSVTDESSSISLSNHSLFQRYYSAAFTPAIEFTSNSGEKSILFSPDQKVKINNSVNFAATFEDSISSASLWARDTPYILIFEFDQTTVFDIGSYFGGMDFNGQIAEIILLDGTDPTFNETRLNVIRDQLNTIHQVY